jgi:hypothetical protein
MKALYYIVTCTACLKKQKEEGTRQMIWNIHVQYAYSSLTKTDIQPAFHNKKAQCQEMGFCNRP